LTEGRIFPQLMPYRKKKEKGLWSGGPVVERVFYYQEEFWTILFPRRGRNVSKVEPFQVGGWIVVFQEKDLGRGEPSTKRTYL